MTEERKAEGSDSGETKSSTKVIRPGWALLSVLIIVFSGLIAALQAPDPQPGKPRTDRTLSEWLRYPLERNSDVRIPSGPAQINSASISDDGLTGFAVGDSGTILRTTDGGKKWEAQDSQVSATLFAVSCDSKCQRAWTVGNTATILVTDDGGKHWNSRKSPTTSDTRLRAVTLLRDGHTGWIAGDTGTVLRTDDSGQTWESQITGETHNLLAIDFNSDGIRGWVVGSDGIILGTTDGGRTWSQRINDNGAWTLLSATFSPDGKRGWAVGYGTLVATEDGGEHWTELRNPDPEVHPDTENEDRQFLTSVFFDTGGNRGWISREDGAIFGTSDGAHTWTKLDSGTNAYLSSMSFDAKAQRGWAVGGAIISTNDGGKSWMTEIGGETSTLHRVYFSPDGKMGWAVGGSGTILATTNGGADWAVQTSGVERSLHAIHFASDQKHGISVGDAGVILATKDGGNHWEPMKSSARVPLNAVQIDADGQRAWVVGSSGIVLRTEDFGLSWHVQHLNHAPILAAVSFDSQGQVGSTIGTNGALFRSTDGGRTWDAQNAKTLAYLTAVWFDTNHQRGWIVGAGGTMLSTADGGATWSNRIGVTTADLNDIQFGSDGRTGWIAGANGLLIRTSDAGETWTRCDSKVGSSREGIAFSADDIHGWAVGYPPALEESDNGGKTWTPIVWPLSNKRFPAPWFWLALLLAVLFLRKSVSTEIASAARGIEALGITDAPIGEFDHDQLQFGSIARGISRFLRNPDTQPPLTMAICGDWGSGKSSLMRLVSTDLRQYGLRPVWFNAWHHQQEEQLLAALLSTIRAKGLPSIASTDGLAFRIRLLLIRSKKHFLLILATMAVSAALIGYLMGHAMSDWAVLWSALNALGARILQSKASIDDNAAPSPVELGRIGAQILSGTAALYSIFKGLTAFKIDPAILLSTTAEKFKLKDASAKTSFRSSFAEEFDEVTRALPYTMVIFIDDLDRCLPRTVLTIMEAVNFLVSSGKCFVIFGMATQKVEAAIAFEFKKFLNKAFELDTQWAVSITEKKFELHKNERGLIYARDYLEKIINLEVNVPERSDLLNRILDGGLGDMARKSDFRAMRTLFEFWPAWIVGLTLVIGLIFGFEYDVPQVSIERASKVTANVPRDEVAAPTSASAAPMTPTVTSAPKQLQNASERYVPRLQENKRIVIDKWTIGITTALVITIVGGLVLSSLRAFSRQVYDSQRFHEALHLWLPVVQRRRITPRAIKRFGNRLRYLAMLQQHPKLDESGFDRLRSALVKLMMPASKRNAALEHSNGEKSEENALDEALLVVLACLFEFYGPKWRTEILQKGDTTLDDAVRNAIKTYTDNTGGTWPPDHSDLAKFEQLLKGVRLSR